MKTLTPFASGLLLTCAVAILATASIAGDQSPDDAYAGGTTDGITPEGIIPLINDDSGASAVISDGSLETPHLQIHNISSADSATVLAVLQTMLEKQPNVRLTIDPKTGNLVAMAPQAAHAAIKATLDELQRDTDVGGGANSGTPGSIKTLDQVRQLRMWDIDSKTRTRYLMRGLTTGDSTTRQFLSDPRKMAMTKVTELRAKLKSSIDRSAVEPRLRAALAEYFIADMGHRVRELDEIKAKIAKTEAELQRRLDAQQESIDLQLKLFIAEADGLGFFRPVDSVEQSTNPYEGGTSTSPNDPLYPSSN